MDPDVDVIPRLMNGLQQLQPQTTMETGASRLITAHAALSNHMYNESRTLRDLSLSLHSSALPLPDTSDLLTSLIDLIPRPPIHPLNELSSLRSVTAQLVAQLAFLSDTLHMARQSSIAANRKLRVAREACAEWKGELEMAERGRRWIEDGDWVGKCSRREAAGVCGEVMEGFERVCVGVEKEMKAMLTV
ncbi:hypothetical protein BDZ91DRAFT_653362 [Kalaharituber pfeilii]|nr:hypothetical protein BDZ91DRAFT_653362 [Kalaharituber pfeilii]